MERASLASTALVEQFTTTSQITSAPLARLVTDQGTCSSITTTTRTEAVYLVSAVTQTTTSSAAKNAIARVSWTTSAPRTMPPAWAAGCRPTQSTSRTIESSIPRTL